jgi:hypothetical protein
MLLEGFKENINVKRLKTKEQINKKNKLHFLK